MTTKIITDHKWKQFKYGYEVPKSIYNNDYDYLDDCDKTDGWIKYRNSWYHISDFMSCHNQIHSPNNPWLKFGYDGYLSDSYFSGVLIKLSDDNEGYQIATFIS
jgi:hypothetical protein